MIFQTINEKGEVTERISDPNKSYAENYAAGKAAHLNKDCSCMECLNFHPDWTVVEASENTSRIHYAPNGKFLPADAYDRGCAKCIPKRIQRQQITNRTRIEAGFEPIAFPLPNTIEWNSWYYGVL